MKRGVREHSWIAAEVVCQLGGCLIDSSFSSTCQSVRGLETRPHTAANQYVCVNEWMQLLVEKGFEWSARQKKCKINATHLPFVVYL